MSWIGNVRAFFGLLVLACIAGCASASPSPPYGDQKGGVGKQTAAGGSQLDSQAQRCVALAMYWEARGEGREGMLAVGSVVLNRVEDGRFPNSVCEVVYEGGETPPCQFSWWCDGKSDRPTQQAAWNKSLSVAQELLAARPEDPTGGALFFHNTTTRPPWRRERTIRIGNHIFYR